MGKEVRGHRTALRVFHFAFLVFVFLYAVGCASPGEPIERRPPKPAAIADLAAHQSGNTVVLTFTLPRETVQGRPLKQTPTIEILRSITATPAGTPPGERAAPPGTSSGPSSTAARPALPLITIPSAMVDDYTEQGHVRYVDRLQSEDFAPSSKEIAIYIVRSQATDKVSSPDSNAASATIYPLPEPIDDLRAEVARHGAGIDLTWSAPQKTPIGAAPPIQSYRIFRAEITSPSSNKTPAGSRPSPMASTAEPVRLKRQFVPMGETQTTLFEDTKTEFGKTYSYSVRSVVEYSGEQRESSDSNLATLTMRDVYPPSAPLGLIAVFVPRVGDTPAHLELSWAISPETEVAGYNVYRSEQQGTLGERLNPELLLTPAFRDMSAVAERRYFYEVTAVDRSGNESSPAAPAAAEMPPESQQP